MPTVYLSINGVQSEPFPIGEDELRRPMISCNYMAHTVGPVASLEDDIIALLVAASVVADGSSIYIGPVATFPADDDGPFTEIILTGGIAPGATHNGTRYPRISFQIVVRATTYAAAQARAKAIHAALDGVYNTTVP